MNEHNFAFAPEFWTFFIFLRICNVRAIVCILACRCEQTCGYVHWRHEADAGSFSKSLRLKFIEAESAAELRAHTQRQLWCFGGLLQSFKLTGVLLHSPGIKWTPDIQTLIFMVAPITVSLLPTPHFLYCLNNEIFLSWESKNNCVSTCPSLWNIY